jgi:HD-GYP domain-containing protein (c-di-GMP phosphodiesterase class II)
MTDKINKIIMLLCKGMSNRKLYYSDHPRVHSLAEEILQLINTHFAETPADELFIGIVDGFFVFEGVRIFGPTVAGKQLIQFAQTLHCGGFLFSKGITVSELKKFMDITALRSLPIKKAEDARALFKSYGIAKIGIGDQYVKQAEGMKINRTKAWGGQSADSAIQVPTFLYQELFEIVSQAYGNAALDRKIDINNAKSVSEFMLRYIQTSFADVMQYVHYPDYDSYTVGHSVRVASLAVYIGTKLNWEEKQLLAIGTAGLLHDIGKSKIPEGILLKKGQLTKREYAVVCNHPQDGVAILLEQKGVSPLDLAACWGHHLRFDGGGYPQQTAWAVRHPTTALLQICDVFEALTAVRPYKNAIEPKGAFALMIADKGAFHPGLLASFIAAVGLYPPGTYVRLNDRRIGMVLESGEQLDRPKLNIVATATGEPLKEDEQYAITLGDPKQKDLVVEKLILDYLE